MDGFAELIERKRQGSLKVYLGYAAGVGKTYAMLQEGLRLKQQLGQWETGRPSQARKAFG